MLLAELDDGITSDELEERTELDEGSPRLDVDEPEDDDGCTLELSVLELSALLEDWLLATKSTVTACVSRLPNKLGPSTSSLML